MSVGVYVEKLPKKHMAVVYRANGNTVVAVTPDLSPKKRIEAVLALLTDEEIASWLPGEVA